MGALRFDVIRTRAAEILGMDNPAGVKNHHLAELFSLSRKTISRYSNRRVEPTLGVAMRISKVLDLPMQDITEEAVRGGAQ